VLLATDVVSTEMIGGGIAGGSCVGIGGGFSSCFVLGSSGGGSLGIGGGTVLGTNGGVDLTCKPFETGESCVREYIESSPFDSVAFSRGETGVATVCVLNVCVKFGFSFEILFASCDFEPTTADDDDDDVTTLLGPYFAVNFGESFDTNGFASDVVTAVVVDVAAVVVVVDVGDAEG